MHPLLLQLLYTPKAIAEAFLREESREQAAECSESPLCGAVVLVQLPRRGAELRLVSSVLRVSTCGGGKLLSETISHALKLSNGRIVQTSLLSDQPLSQVQPQKLAAMCEELCFHLGNQMPTKEQVLETAGRLRDALHSLQQPQAAAPGSRQHAAQHQQHQAGLQQVEDLRSWLARTEQFLSKHWDQFQRAHSVAQIMWPTRQGSFSPRAGHSPHAGAAAGPFGAGASSAELTARAGAYGSAGSGQLLAQPMSGAEGVWAGADTAQQDALQGPPALPAAGHLQPSSVTGGPEPYSRHHRGRSDVKMSRSRSRSRGRLKRGSSRSPSRPPRARDNGTTRRRGLAEEDGHADGGRQGDSHRSGATQLPPPPPLPDKRSGKESHGPRQTPPPALSSFQPEVQDSLVHCIRLAALFLYRNWQQYPVPSFVLNTLLPLPPDVFQVLGYDRESYSRLAKIAERERSPLLLTGRWSHPDLCDGDVTLPVIFPHRDIVPGLLPELEEMYLLPFFPALIDPADPPKAIGKAPTPNSRRTWEGLNVRIPAGVYAGGMYIPEVTGTVVSAFTMTGPCQSLELIVRVQGVDGIDFFGPGGKVSLYPDDELRVPAASVQLVKASPGRTARLLCPIARDDKVVASVGDEVSVLEVQDRNGQYGKRAVLARVEFVPGSKAYHGSYKAPRWLPLTCLAACSAVPVHPPALPSSGYEFDKGHHHGATSGRYRRK